HCLMITDICRSRPLSVHGHMLPAPESGGLRVAQLVTRLAGRAPDWSVLAFIGAQAILIEVQGNAEVSEAPDSLALEVKLRIHLMEILRHADVYLEPLRDGLDLLPFGFQLCQQRDEVCFDRRSFIQAAR